MSAAGAYAQKGDFRSASLTARQVLQQNPSNVRMCRLMAQIADAVDSPEAIVWWSRAVKLEDGRFNAIAALVSTALRFEETTVAEEALAQIHEPDRKTAACHQLVAAYAVATNQFGLADAEFSEAARIEPQNESIQLDLASVRLLSTRPEVAEAARAVLERLRQKPKFNLMALRALLSDARKHGETEKALQLARELAGAPGGNFQDQLALLDELRAGGLPDFDAKLQLLKNTAAETPAVMQKMIRWMNARGMAADAFEWAESCGTKIRSQIPVQLAMAESLSVLGKWEDLRGLLIRWNWRELDFLRLAIQARTARETTHTMEEKSKWQDAIIAAHGDVRTLSMLARLVNGWGWEKEAVQVWWLIAGHDAGQRAALKSLYKLYSDERNTPQLYRVAARVFELEPDNPVAKNNWAALSLLLGRNLEKANQLALENYRNYPANAGVASTYAFALYCGHKTGEALKILGTFPEETLRQPSIAAYYGVLLAAGGNRAGARPFLEIAARDDRLLPEEKALVDQVLKP